MTVLRKTIFGRIKLKPIPAGSFISYWKLISNSNDSVGVLNGINTNVTFAAGGKVGNALTYPSTGTALVDYGDTNLLSFTDGTNDKSFSFSLWVNFGTITSNSFANVFSKLTVSPLREYYLMLRSSVGTSDLVFLLSNSGNNDNIQVQSATPVGNFQSNTWYHIAGTYDGSKSAIGLNLFINKINLGAKTTTGTYTGMTNTTQPFKLGVVNSNAFNLRGQLCEVAFFNRVITQKEIDWCYQKGINGQHLL